MGSRRTLKILLGLFALGLLALLGAALAAKPLIRHFAEREARERGVNLELEELAFGFGWLRLSNARFSLVDLPAVSGSLTDVQIELNGLEARRIAVTGMRVRLVGSLTNLALALSRWSSTYPHVYQLPLDARGVHLTWQSGWADPAWLIVEEGSVVPVNEGRSFTAERTRVSGFAVGKTGATWTARESLVSIGLGTSDLAAAPLTVRIKPATPRASVEIRLAPTLLSTLADASGIKLPDGNILASGSATLSVPDITAPAPVTGKLSGKLDGFVPPHPPELDGFIFGNVTTLESAFEVSADQARARLTETRVAAGAFRLNGGGSVERLSDHARIVMKLNGALPCGALAGAALTSRLGKTLGPLLARGARELLAGSVAVTINVDADSRDVAGARVDRVIGIGCGLKPLRLPKELEELGKVPLPALPSSLPPWPSALPRIPTAFPLPR